GGAGIGWVSGRISSPVTLFLVQVCTFRTAGANVAGPGRFNVNGPSKTPESQHYSVSVTIDMFSVQVPNASPGITGTLVQLGASSCFVCLCQNFLCQRQHGVIYHGPLVADRTQACLLRRFERGQQAAEIRDLLWYRPIHGVGDGNMWWMHDRDAGIADIAGTPDQSLDRRQIVL